MGSPVSSAPAPVTHVTLAPPAVATGGATRPVAERAGAVAALDGVRGLAILLVLAFHFAAFPAVESAGPASPAGELLRNALRAGWLGVDLFFVLSGFLITGILHDAREERGYWRAFYTRRALRILPLYYLLLATLLLLPRIVPAAAAALAVERAHQGWYWLHATNVRFALGPWPPVTGHLWSLAIEEQFYLVWPFVVRWTPRRALVRTCAALVATSVVLRAWAMLSGHPPAWGYMLTPLRLDALAAGAMLALALRGDAERRAAVAGRVRTLAILGAVVLAGVAYVAGRLFFLDPLMQLVGFPAAAALGAALVHHAATRAPGSVAVRPLEWGWLRWLGRRSYALYLLQQPLLLLWGAPVALARTMVAAGVAPALAEMAHVVVACAALALLAEATWRLVEGPALALKRLVPYEGERQHA